MSPVCPPQGEVGNEMKYCGGQPSTYDNEGAWFPESALQKSMSLPCLGWRIFNFETTTLFFWTRFLSRSHSKTLVLWWKSISKNFISMIQSKRYAKVCYKMLCRWRRGKRFWKLTESKGVVGLEKWPEENQTTLLLVSNENRVGKRMNRETKGHWTLKLESTSNVFPSTKKFSGPSYAGHYNNFAKGQLLRQEQFSWSPSGLLIALQAFQRKKFGEPSFTRRVDCEENILLQYYDNISNMEINWW